MDEAQKKTQPTDKVMKEDINNEKLKDGGDLPKRRPRWVTRAMAEELSREEVLSSTLKEMIIYLVFVIVVTIATVGRHSSAHFYLTQAIKQQFVDREFTTDNDVGITFQEITTASDFWHYAETLMVNSFYWEYYYNNEDPVEEAIEDDKKIIYENKLLGVPRIRQVKVRNDSCVIHEYFRRLFLSCYDTYDQNSKDEESFGLGAATAWVYSDVSVTKSIPFSGRVATYDGSGFYQDLAQNKNGSSEILAQLKEGLWITRGTRAIFVDFAIYNANLNLFSICKLIFEFPPTGGVIPSTSLKTVDLIEYIDDWDYFMFSCTCAMYALAAFYLMEEVREFAYFKSRYFLQFWSYIDLTIIGMTIATILTHYVFFPSISEAIDRIRHNPNKYANLEYIGEMRVLFNNFSAALLFFVYVKIFKYLNFNKTMGQLNNTLKRCAWDILGFSIMFFIIFFAFAELGYLLFGSQVEDFSSFGVAMFTLLRTILGDFDYSAIESANRVLAPVYFLSYIFFVFFVLLNMFLAIINDTYADVKTEIAIAPDEMQMTDFIKRGLYNFLRRWGCNVKQWTEPKSEFNATVQQIREALKKCGFSDLEIEMFFARYNIDPLAEVGEYDIKKLMAELESQSGPGKDDEDSSFVQLSDFIAQQERLDQIEHTIELVAGKIDALLKKLEALENVHKSKAAGH